eukprot:1202477-Amphidinium_carterae.1
MKSSWNISSAAQRSASAFPRSSKRSGLNGLLALCCGTIRTNPLKYLRDASVPICVALLPKP